MSYFCLLQLDSKLLQYAMSRYLKEEKNTLGCAQLIDESIICWNSPVYYFYAIFICCLNEMIFIGGSKNMNCLSDLIFHSWLINRLFDVI